MVESCGLLLYRLPGPEVLLGHMGGPFWARKDEGAWSVPKGLRDPGEDPRAAARREFAEEIGPVPPGEPRELGAWRVGGGKRLTVFVLEGAFDPADQVSTTFEMEWPPRSGRTEAFPEIDRAAWFDLPTAARKVARGQVPALEALAALLG